MHPPLLVSSEEKTGARLSTKDSPNSSTASYCAVVMGFLGSTCSMFLICQASMKIGARVCEMRRCEGVCIRAYMHVRARVMSVFTIFAVDHEEGRLDEFCHVRAFEALPGRSGKFGLTR